MTQTSARFRGRVIAMGFLCVAQAIARAAVADESVALAWQGGAGTEGCSKPEELQRAVEVQMGRNVFLPAEAPAKLTIVVKVERREEPRGFHATVWVEAEDRRDPGTRELDASGDDCRALDEPLALVVALMADSELARPVAVEEPPPPEPEPPPQKRVEATDEQDLLPIETGPPPERAGPWRTELGVAVLGAYDVLPNLSAGAELALFLGPSSFPALMLHGAAFLPRAEEVGPDASVTFFLAHGGVSLCPELWSSKGGMLRGCGGAIVGALRAESSGFLNGRDATRLVIAADIGLRGRLELGGGALATAALSLLMPFRPETFTYKSDGRPEKIFQMGHLAFVASLGGAYEIR